MVRPGAYGGAARLLRARDDCRARDSRRAAHEKIFPALVLLAWRVSCDTVRTVWSRSRDTSADDARLHARSANLRRAQIRYRKALVVMGRWVRDLSRRDIVSSFERELWMCFFAGFIRQRWNTVAQKRTDATVLRTRSGASEPHTPVVFPVESRGESPGIRLRVPVQP